MKRPLPKKRTLLFSTSPRMRQASFNMRMAIIKVTSALIISCAAIGVGYKLMSDKVNKPAAAVPVTAPNEGLAILPPPSSSSSLMAAISEAGGFWQIVFLFLGIAGALFFYLRPDERFRETPARYRSLSKGPGSSRLIDQGPDRAYFDRFEELGTLVDEEDSDNGADAGPRRMAFRVGENERQEMLKRVEDKLYAELYPQVLNDLENRFAKSAFSTGATEQLFELLDACRERLEGEVAALTKRGTLNLIVGVVLSGLVLLVLGEMSYSAMVAEPPETWAAAGTSYLPRLSLAVFIQIFAFFFLKIYRATLSEIKYFHNEITSVDMICAAFTDALRIGDKTVQGDVVRAVAAIDKNQRLRASPKHAAENDEGDVLSLLASFTEALSKIKK